MTEAQALRALVMRLGEPLLDYTSDGRTTEHVMAGMAVTAVLTAMLLAQADALGCPDAEAIYLTLLHASRADCGAGG